MRELGNIIGLNQLCYSCVSEREKEYVLQSLIIRKVFYLFFIFMYGGMHFFRYRFLFI